MKSFRKGDMLFILAFNLVYIYYFIYYIPIPGGRGKENIFEFL